MPNMQNDCRVNRGLALNLGVGYEIFSVLTESRNSYAKLDNSRKL